MQELKRQWAKAPKVSLASVEALGPADVQPKRMGGLLITAIFLRDVGLIG